jgi:uncharacterized membrane protein YidH (DUF202 family)
MDNTHIFKWTYTIVMVVVFTGFSLSIKPSGANNSTIFLIRTLISLIFFGIGSLLYVYHKSLGPSFYKRQIALIKRKTSEKKMAQQIKYIASCLMVVGLLILSISTIMKLIV